MFVDLAQRSNDRVARIGRFRATAAGERSLVAAAFSIDKVVPGLAEGDVLLGATQQSVDSPARDGRVLAVVAVQKIVAGVAGQPVIACAANQCFVAPQDEAQCLDLTSRENRGLELTIWRRLAKVELELAITNPYRK